MTSSISIDDYLAWFSVVTDHAGKLEFVLDDVEEQTGTNYVDALDDMLKDQFKDIKTVKVEEVQIYYDVSFLISASSPEELQWALKRCEGVTARWINKYRINSMKQNEKRA